MPYPKSNNRQARRRVVTCKQSTLDTPLSALDLPAVRTMFSELTDAASEILFGERLDFDDVIVDRFILTDSKGIAACKVPADWLSDRDRLIEHVVSCMGKQSVESDVESVGAADIRIIGLVVEIVQVAGPI